MRVNKLPQSGLSFQRALTTKEKIEYGKITNEARKELNIADTASIIFDFNTPSDIRYNFGIGTMNSNYAEGFIDFLKDIASISRIQAGPQSDLDYHSNGKTYLPTTSPYSGSTFTLGRHTIALEKLAGKNYGNLLDEDYIQSLTTPIALYPKADYDYALGDNKDGAIFQGLKQAYQNLQNDPDNPMNIQFETFKRNMSEDIENDILFEAIADEYHAKGKNGCDYKNWDEKDRFLFDRGSDAVIERKEELKDKIDFLAFCQFIAKKQHLETKEMLNKKGIKLTGDCLVCFSPKEVWANRECFMEGWFTGGIDPFCPETNNIQPWGSPALDYDKLGEFDPKTGDIIKLGKTGELLYRKFKHFNELYDGIRIDAFWQYVSPFIYTKRENYHGESIQGVDTKIIKIMEKAGKDSGNKLFNPDDYILELIGFNTEKGKELTINKFPHVYSTAYAEYDESPYALMRKKGYKDGKLITGATSHDNDSLVNMSKNEERRCMHSPLLKMALGNGYNHLGYKSEKYEAMSNKEKKEANFRTAKAAENFTTQRQYFTLPDLFGMPDRINISGKVDKDNWSVQIPSNYERAYYSALSNGFGINFPKCYEVALYAKESKNTALINKLSKMAEILAQDGPMTTKEADELERAGKLDYSA